MPGIWLGREEMSRGTGPGHASPQRGAGLGLAEQLSHRRHGSGRGPARSWRQRPGSKAGSGRHCGRGYFSHVFSVGIYSRAPPGFSVNMEQDSRTPAPEEAADESSEVPGLQRVAPGRPVRLIAPTPSQPPEPGRHLFCISLWEEGSFLWARVGGERTACVFYRRRNMSERNS